MTPLDQFLFGYYPYIALTVFLLGSLIRFDRDQYTWKSDSSQLLRAGQLRWGSNLFHVRIRVNSKTSDIVLLVLLWLQFALGLATLPLSAPHLDGGMMMKLAEWAQRIVTFRAGAPELLAEAGWVFKGHMFLGMSIFLIFPFTRLVHVWSGFGTLAYVVRPYQLVRSRRLGMAPRAPLSQRDRAA